ncbi:hypothetical protein M9434_000796 [Picochlorum sp. BPE23]|nr:hypothetical protein M9434_000796 [Picochlorum sp. BPE23]KAI8111532.1 hypothetical protein M9435_004032 [Picochlorum sp. BPE23]
MSATVVGALLGVGVQLYANVAQKLPALSSPWRHAASAVIGAGFASLVLDVEERATKDVQERMAARVAADTKQRA